MFDLIVLLTPNWDQQCCKNGNTAPDFDCPAVAQGNCDSGPTSPLRQVIKIMMNKFAVHLDPALNWDASITPIMPSI